MEEIQKTVKQVNRDKYELEKVLEEPVELDEMELSWFANSWYIHITSNP